GTKRGSTSRSITPEWAPERLVAFLLEGFKGRGRPPLNRPGQGGISAAPIRTPRFRGGGWSSARSSNCAGEARGGAATPGAVGRRQSRTERRTARRLPEFAD